MTTYADLAAATPTRELLRQSTTHRITCKCDRCTALYAELAKRQQTAADAIRSQLYLGSTARDGNTPRFDS